MPTKVTILGAGTWGCAISMLLERQGCEVTLWGHNAEHVRILNQSRVHSQLPNAQLPESISIADSISDALSSSTDAILFAVPAQKTAEVARRVAAFVTREHALINLSKGIEQGTLRRMSQVLCDEIPNSTSSNVVTLSGPSHAEEVAQGLPTSVVAASESETAAQWTQELFSCDSFRVYRSSDIVGVELGGSVKNIIAIASGVLLALNLGDNAQGALLTRGLAEMSRLGEKLGAEVQTFAGLSGLGDLVTTCFSRHSRNRKFGELIGAGRTVSQARDEVGMVAEGVDTCRAVYELARQERVETPITEQVYFTLFESRAPKDALKELMSRPLREEFWTE